MIDLPDGTTISAEPVTFRQFVRLLTTEDYFRPHIWSRLADRPPVGGDIVLRRLDFDPARSQRPVAGVSWFEADAYCRWAGGRLPSCEELQHVRHDLTAAPPEWCDDWFNAKAVGRKVFPEPPPRKRVIGWPVADCAAPEITGAPFTFRVAFDRPPSVSFESGSSAGDTVRRRRETVRQSSGLGFWRRITPRRF